MRRASLSRTGLVLLASVAGWIAAPAQAQNVSMVVRDAETGQLRAPTADEAREISASSPTMSLSRARSSASASIGPRGMVTGSTTPATWQLPDGTVISETTEDMMSATVVIRGKDGRLVQQCVQNLAVAERLLKTPVEVRHAVR